MLKPSEAAIPVNRLNAQFFGVSTILISDGKSSVLIDGFFSRPNAFKLLLGPLEPNLCRIQDAFAKGSIQKIDALLVAHSHHDHALDSAIVAQRANAILYGSQSTLNIAAGQGLCVGKFVLIDTKKTNQIGAFKISFFETPHSEDSLFPGIVDRPLPANPKLRDFKAGENYSFYLMHARGSVLIVPSANFHPGHFRGVKADVVFLGIGGLGHRSEDYIRSYWRDIVVETGARLVIPIHWDDFTLPLDKPLKPLPYLADNINETMRVLCKTACETGVRIGFMPLYEKIEIPIDPEHVERK